MTTPDHAVESYRAFVALALSHAVGDSLQLYVAQLRQQSSLHHLRWIPEKNWHLTLAFLGDQPQATLHTLWQDLISKLQDVSALSADIVAISAFPDAKSSILAALLDPTEPLRSLRAHVAAVCTKNGIALDERDFKPHITLARAGRGQRVNYPDECLHLSATWNSVKLYTSQLTPSGSVYTPLRTLALPLSDSP